MGCCKILRLIGALLAFSLQTSSADFLKDLSHTNVGKIAGTIKNEGRKHVEDAIKDASKSHVVDNIANQAQETAKKGEAALAADSNAKEESERIAKQSAKKEVSAPPSSKVNDVLKAL